MNRITIKIWEQKEAMTQELVTLHNHNQNRASKIMASISISMITMMARMLQAPIKILVVIKILGMVAIREDTLTFNGVTLVVIRMQIVSEISHMMVSVHLDQVAILHLLVINQLEVALSLSNLDHNQLLRKLNISINRDKILGTCLI